MTMVAVVFPMGGKRLVHSQRGQYSVANAGWCITVGAIQCCQRECGSCDRKPAVVRKRGGGDTHKGAKPTRGTHVDAGEILGSEHRFLKQA